MLRPFRAAHESIFDGSPHKNGFVGGRQIGKHPDNTSTTHYTMANTLEFEEACEAVWRQIQEEEEMFEKACLAYEKEMKKIASETRKFEKACRTVWKEMTLIAV
jgi:hypothetical protein